MWPSALDGLFDIFTLMSLNLVENSRVPCWYPKFNYIDLFSIMALLPLILLVVCFIYGTLSAHYCSAKKGPDAGPHAPRRRGAVRHVETTFAGGLKRAAKKGLAAWIPLFFFVYDMIYPLVCRTLLQYFSCRDLPPAGKFLERERIHPTELR